MRFKPLKESNNNLNELSERGITYNRAPTLPTCMCGIICMDEYTFLGKYPRDIGKVDIKSSFFFLLMYIFVFCYFIPNRAQCLLISCCLDYILIWFLFCCVLLSLSWSGGYLQGDDRKYMEQIWKIWIGRRRSKQIIYIKNIKKFQVVLLMDDICFGFYDMPPPPPIRMLEKYFVFNHHLSTLLSPQVISHKNFNYTWELPIMKFNLFPNFSLNCHNK